jgi:AcrR family transcriptional regulator
MTVHSLIVTPMSPRPRETTDHAILEAAYRAMSQHGPARLTLAHVAREVGVAPATLMQRFGSKRGLLLALARQSAGTTGQQYAAIRAAHRSPLAALFAVAECMAGLAPTPEVLANNLAYLHVDLTDADFHEIALAQARAARGEVRAILDAAVAARELAPCDTVRLARLVGVMLGGGLLAWAIEREGTAAEWLRDDLEALLAPFRKRKSRGSGEPHNVRRKSKGRR